MTRLRMVGDAIAAVITHLTTPAARRQAARDADTVRFAELVVARDTNGDKP
jgi:hypothetical protein